MMDWIVKNYQEMGAVLLLFIAFAEAAVRLTPTKKDDGFVQRVGAVIKSLLDLLRIPNLLKKPKE